MHKLGLIIKREYWAKVKNKSFVVMTFLSPILMVGLVVLVTVLTQMNDTEERVVAVLNPSDFLQGSFHDLQDVSVVDFKGISLEKAMDSTQSMGLYGLLYIPKGKTIAEIADETVFYSNNTPSASFLSSLEYVFQERIQQDRLQQLGVDRQQWVSLNQKFQLEMATFSGGRNIKGASELKAIIGGGLGYLIMMFIIIYGGFVMRSVIEEKTSRIIEVIISSVKPFQLMLGKILGTSLAGLTQFAVWIVIGGLLFLAAMAFLGISPSAVLGNTPVSGLQPDSPISTSLEPYILELLDVKWGTLGFFFGLYFLLGYLIYSSIYAAIGAAVDNETDTQQFIFPVILPLILAIYVGFFSVFGNPHGPIAVAFSLFPFTSPIVMLMRLPGGIGGVSGVPVWQVLLSVVLLVLTFLTIVWFAAKIYRVGILMYGKKPSYKELYKWLKY